MDGLTIGLAASPWIVALVALAGFAFAVFSYNRTLPPVPPLRRWSLILLRTIGLTLLLLALFEPVLSFLNESAEEPEVIVAIDNSESMTLGGDDSTRIADARKLAATILGSKLGEKSTFVTFSDSLQHILPVFDSIRATGPETRLESPFTYTSDSLARHNIRAIVLLTDGRYNSGANPIVEAERLGIPVYTVGIGDSVEPKDVSVQQVFTNAIGYVGSEQPVEIRVKAAGYDAGGMTVSLRDDTGPFESKQLTMAPGTNEYTVTFSYAPKREGTAKLTATVTGPEGELTGKNNSRVTFVNVKSNKRRYVLIAGSPSPDVAFLRRLLGSNKDIEVATFIQKNSSEFLEGNPTAASFKDAEAVIIVDYPTRASSPAVLGLVKNTVQNANLPLFVVLGSQTDIGRLKELESLLPVTLGQAREREMLVFTDITSTGRSNPATRVSDSTGWSQLPPIYRTETLVRPRPESEVLATARLAATPLDEPLIVSRKIGRSRSLIVLGYGIYRWELLGDGPREARGETGNDILGTFVSNSLRWLATQEDEKQVQIRTSKELYTLGEAVRILGQVYDDSYLPLSDAEVSVVVQGPDERYPISLAPMGNGRFEGTLSNLPPGDYSYSGTATYNSRAIGSDGGRFTIGEIGIEFLQTAMNPELLRSLAARTGGVFYTPRTSSTLIDDISSNPGFTPRTIETNEEYALWNLLWVLIAAITAFALEWLIRKRSGML